MTSTGQVARAQRVIDLFASVRTYRTMKDTAIRLARIAEWQARKNLVMSARHSNRVMIITLRRALQEQANWPLPPPKMGPPENTRVCTVNPVTNAQKCEVHK